MTPGPETVRTRIEAANAYLGAQLDWQPIGGGGTTNRLYRARLNGRPLVLRLNADEEQAFGVRRQQEAAVLALIQGYDWAPRVLHNAWQAGWCLMADHGPSPETSPNPSSSPSFSPLSKPENDFSPASMLLDAVTQWQQIDVGPVFDYSGLFARYRKSLRSAAWLLLVDRMEAVYGVLPPVPARLTHHDLHIGNLCRDGKQLVVVDWEYAATGNPWFDAAALHREFGIAFEAIALLPAWQGQSELRFGEGMAMALWLGEVLGCLWYGVRTQNVAGAGKWVQDAERLLMAPLPVRH